MLILFTLAGALLLGAASRCEAASMTLGWNPSPSTGVAGYYIYYGTSSGNYTVAVPVSATTTNVTISGLTSGQTYYFAAAAYDASNNVSAPSPEISGVAGAVAQAAGMLSAIVGLPAGQFGFTLSGASGTYIVQASTDLVHWVSLQTNSANSQFVDSNTTAFPRRFYRTAYTSN
jgi:hypothetical protein